MAMKGEAIMAYVPFREKVYAKYGSPMGRHSDDPETLTGKTHLRRVPFVDGDYDPGGAYWGSGGGPLFCAWGYGEDENLKVCYVRAANRDQAKASFPNASFYR